MFYRKIFIIIAFTGWLVSAAQTDKIKSAGHPSGSIPAAGYVKNISDSALLDLVQKQTFRYFWDFAHPVSGLARERSNITDEYGWETTTTGGTGFGIMGVIVAVNRGWITRDTAVGFLLRMVRFLRKADNYHGVFPHWLNGETGKTLPFSPKDDGGDLVETSYLFQGLLCAREYFNKDIPLEKYFRNRTQIFGILQTGIGTQKIIMPCFIGTGV